MAGWGNNDHWTAPHFDKYGFRRSELKALAESIGIDLDIPLEKIKPNTLQPQVRMASESDIESMRLEIESLKSQIKKLENERPILLNKHRDDDPLYLAMKIRNREWSRYDPENDRATRGNQMAIIKELEENNFSNAQAKAIEMVACPIKR